MNTIRKQSGFTLIELMIVIAILAILLAIAIPAYQDYSIRARVSEGLNMASSAKMAVSEHRLSEGTFPGDNATAGYETGVSSLVASIVVGGNGVITVTYSSIATLGDAAGDTLTLTPTFSGTAVIWSCATGTIEDKFVPAECR
ncbi:MAG: prepilin-type N-terminal cleavage/methylation domain-containing protein [Pseudomonadota bacterium]|nr:MAG: prepilin-type N-terminal cleavage/methylation domain-containing protein [Pseudomonadota bacterium]